MRIRRGLLFWGLFLIPLGGITLLVRAGVLDADRLVDAWRLWPLILIGIGVAILLGRGRSAIAASAVVAIILVSLGGAALASGHVWVGALSDCAIGGATTDQLVTRTGSFSAAPTVRLNLDCGELHVTPGSDAGWSVDAGYHGSAPTIDATGSLLQVRSVASDGTGSERRNDWTIRLPAGSPGAGVSLTSLSLTANAASADLTLPAGHVGSLDADLNAGDLRIDASGTAIDDIGLSMNAGRIRLSTGASPMSGDISVNAGSIDLCVPDGVGLRLDVTDQLTFVTNLGSRGLTRNGENWTRVASAGNSIVALSIDGSAASLNLNPAGGCR
jgi:hypothetical protein